MQLCLPPPHMKVWGKVQLTRKLPTTTTKLQMNQSWRGCRCMGRESTSSGSNICGTKRAGVKRFIV